MLKIVGAVALAAGLACASDSAFAAQMFVSHMDKGADGSTTYHYTLVTDPGESVSFVTVYNFAGVNASSIKAPAGWTASSPEFGKTPMHNGYAWVSPTDIPDLNNVTWTAGKAIPGGSKIEGFSATTSVSGTTEGEYSVESSRNAGGKPSKQAAIGTIESPAFWPH
jgi:hypothetical protein